MSLDLVILHMQGAKANTYTHRKEGVVGKEDNDNGTVNLKQQTTFT